jgi:hypothetical protein
MSATRKINPLYVVSKDKKNVEEAANFFDLLLKKTGLNQLWSMLETVIALLLSQVQSYPMFLEVKKVIDKLLVSVLAVLAL